MAIAVRILGWCAFFLAAGLAPASARAREFSGATTSGDARVRSGNARLSALITEATDRSPAFKALLASIAETDGIVFVEAGTCRRGVPACLTWQVTLAGSYRILFVLLDTRKPELDLMASMGRLAAIEPGPVDGQGANTTASRVRTAEPDIAQTIAQAIEWSKTFRRLVEAIERTDGVVWITRGRCDGASACLLVYLEVSGPNRLLRIHVAARLSGDRLMESLGHELQHAVEVLGTSARTSAGVYHFFDHQAGAYRIGGRFETNEAVQAGLAVGREVARARRPGVSKARQP